MTEHRVTNYQSVHTSALYKGEVIAFFGSADVFYKVVKVSRRRRRFKLDDGHWRRWDGYVFVVTFA